VLFLFAKGSGFDIIQMGRMMKGLRKNGTRDRNPFLFWQRWLLVSGLLFAAGSVALAIINDEYISWYNQKLIAVFGLQKATEESTRLISFLRGPMGGTMACCYILLSYIAAFPFQNKETWARDAIVVGFGFWMLLDTAACLYYSMYLQVVVNVISLLVKALPLVFTWKYFATPGTGARITSGIHYLKN
jgi:hypothetical protein